MMLYRNTKVKIHLLMETNFFNIVAGVLQDILATYLFIICLDNILQMLLDLIKENGLILKAARSRWYPAGTIINTDHIVLFVNTPAQAKSLLHTLE